MRDFETEKSKLIQDLEIEIRNAQYKGALEKIKGLVDSLQSHADLDGALSDLVHNELDNKIQVGEKIIDFENYFRDKTNLIKSDYLRQIAKSLKNKGIEITFFGYAWTRQRASWIYFNTVLNIEELRNNFNLADHIVIHKNLDPKSGTEKGFLDNITGEGLMGKLK